MGNVWARGEPEYHTPRLEVLYKGTPVTVFSVYGQWMEVEWYTAGALHRGWVPREWITLVEPLDTNLITPTIVP